MDRYQEEIRRVAAKSVKDLNLDHHTGGTGGPSNYPGVIPRRLSNGSDGSSSSSPRCVGASNAGNGTIGVNVAVARMEYLQKVNQLNLSNSLLSGGTTSVHQSLPRRQSAEREVSGGGKPMLVMGKTKSATDLNGTMGSGMDRRSIIAASKLATPRVIIKVNLGIVQTFSNYGQCRYSLTADSCLIIESG